MERFLRIVDTLLGVIVIFGGMIALLHAREVLEMCVDLLEDLSVKWDRWLKGLKIRKR